jgi:hypothetical protein
MTDPSTPQSTSANPLAQYFRLPGLHVRLPTNGAFLPEGSFTPDAQGTVPVFPMRASDEYLLKNPDALMSGFALQKLLESCVPSIKDVGSISSPDLDILMMAIRIATYGETMDLAATCPKCNEESEFVCYLPGLLETVKQIQEECPVRLNDEIIAFVRPYNFNNATQMSLLTFNETRRLQAAQQNSDLTEEQRTAEMRISMEKISNLEASITANCVYKIVTPTATVTDPGFIAEFLNQTNSKFVKQVENALIEMNDSGLNKTLKVKCSNVECGHEWETNVEFDPTSFFE